MSHFLSRLRLAPNPTTDALKHVLDPDERGEAMDTHHRLLWTAFAANAPADKSVSHFLWRSEGKGVFYVLSSTKPDQGLLFQPPEVKDFAPRLATGDRLHFVLRVNATKTRPTRHLSEENGKLTHRRVDIVMHELFKIPHGEARRERRHEVANDVGCRWMSEQGNKYGFEVQQCSVETYSVQALPNHRGRRAGQPQFGILDLKGSLTVKNPIAFTEKLLRGFGRAKAFGCGLMMIRRA